MAADKTKNKYVRLGTVLKSKEGEGSYIALGSTRAKDPKYNFDVDVTVRDASGKVVAKQTNGFLSVFNPRSIEGRKVPDSVLFDISLKLPQ
jgi:hypothetical protein